MPTNTHILQIQIIHDQKNNHNIKGVILKNSQVIYEIPYLPDKINIPISEKFLYEITKKFNTPDNHLYSKKENSPNTPYNNPAPPLFDNEFDEYDEHDYQDEYDVPPLAQVFDVYDDNVDLDVLFASFGMD